MDQLVLRDFDPDVLQRSRAAEFEATFEIESLAVLEGELPARALRLVAEWAGAHRMELMEDWRLCRANATPAKIEPLV
jgi:Domain of unknown function (DUF4160)